MEILAEGGLQRKIMTSGNLPSQGGRKVRAATEALSEALQIERKQKIKHLVSDLMEVRCRNDLSDEVFSELLEVVLVGYVENEISSLLDHSVGKKLNRYMSWSIK